MMRQFHFERWFTAILMAMTFVSTSLMATSPDSSSSQKWALQFGVSENFRLSNFQGSTISLEHQMKDDRAFRFGTSISGNFGVNDGDRSDNIEYDDNYSRLRCEILSYYVFKGTVKDNFRPYWGIGPLAGYSYEYSERKMTQGFYSERRKHEWNIGVGGIFGLEWKILKRIKLLAEYSNSFRFRSYLSNVVQKDDVAEPPKDLRDRADRKSLEVNASSVRCGLAISF